jgi:hypothetical protein
VGTEMNRQLEILCGKIIHEFCEVMPDMGGYFGLPEYDFLLTYPRKERVESFIEFLESTLQEIKAISGLSEMEKIDQEVLEFWVNYIIFDLQVPPYEESNIDLAYLILTGIPNILRLDRLSNKQKLARVLARLNQCPAIYERVRETWTRSTLWNLDQAIYAGQDLERKLLEMLEPLIGSFPEEKEAVSHLFSVISKKEKDFLRWLEEKVRPKTTVLFRPIGKENYQKLLQTRKEGHTWSERLQLGEESLRESKERLLELSKAVDPEVGTVEAALSRVEADQQKLPFFEECRNAYEKTVEFLKDKHLLSVPDYPVSITEPPSCYGWIEGEAGICVGEILSKKPLLNIFVVAPKTEEGRRYINRNFIQMVMAHEGGAGHASSFLLRKERGNIVRLLNPIMTGLDDRWTFYWEEVLAEEGIKPTPEYKFYIQYRVLTYAVRQILDVEYHIGLVSFEECVSRLEKEAYVTRQTAEAMMRDIVIMPAYFSSFIPGEKHLLELKEYVKDQLGERYSEELFHRWVGEAGVIPYTLLKREIEERVKQVKRN